MPNLVDARGRSCPEPVIMTKNAVENYKGDTIEVMVDTMVAVENIKRFVENKGFKVDVQEREGDYSLAIKK
ncbi:sulfurtransferase TusA family protein [Dethiothermospora halolimnae]|uniref:sulfurtransferase TusA family protein n=1 Tax=Dethiothermospora halolimnae TaxID=3114390 RepID=UPI003CCB8294